MKKALKFFDGKKTYTAIVLAAWPGIIDALKAAAEANGADAETTKLIVWLGGASVLAVIGLVHKVVKKIDDLNEKLTPARTQAIEREALANLIRMAFKESTRGLFGVDEDAPLEVASPESLRERAKRFARISKDNAASLKPGTRQSLTAAQEFKPSPASATFKAQERE